MRIRKWHSVLLAAVFAMTGLGACGSGGGDTRTIEVDYRSDDFAGIFRGYFPRKVTVTPGMTLRFHQTWTGEPHSVTFGTIVNKAYAPIGTLIDEYVSGKTPIPDEPPPEYDEKLWSETLPFFFGEEDGINQSAALPCFAPKESDLPLDKAKPCAQKFREQPEFDGTHAYYSSGFIPFEGENENEFEMKIADDTKDGAYAFYCNLHDVLMSGEITVKRGAKVESQGDINRRGAREAARTMRSAREQYEKEKAGQGEFDLPLAGSGGENVTGMGSVVEFTPRTINAKVGEKVTWTFVEDHSITFNVPPYTPLFVFDKRRFLEFNEELDKPAGGWPGPPERPEQDGPPDPNTPPPEPVSVDAGEWDGSGGIRSSGTGWETGDKYSVTFTKAGTYPYACLIHPGQIGKVVVK